VPLPHDTTTGEPAIQTQHSKTPRFMQHELHRPGRLLEQTEEGRRNSLLCYPIELRLHAEELGQRLELGVLHVIVELGDLDLLERVTDLGNVIRLLGHRPDLLDDLVAKLLHRVGFFTFLTQEVRPVALFLGRLFFGRFLFGLGLLRSGTARFQPRLDLLDDFSFVVACEHHRNTHGLSFHSAERHLCLADHGGDGCSSAQAEFGTLYSPARARDALLLLFYELFHPFSSQSRPFHCTNMRHHGPEHHHPIHPVNFFCYMKGTGSAGDADLKIYCIQIISSSFWKIVELLHNFYWIYIRLYHTSIDIGLLEQRGWKIREFHIYYPPPLTAGTNRSMPVSTGHMQLELYIARKIAAGNIGCYNKGKRAGTKEERMTDYLKKYGLTVVKNGWPIVLLPHGSKKPIGFKWQEKVVTEHDIKRALASGKEYGFGIKCGNVVGIDDDYEESDTVTETFLDAVKELKDHYFPKSLWRRGRPTRQPLRVIRLKDGEAAKSLNVDKLQIIGKGRQFVAYNLHPDTGESYVWLKGEDEGIGSPVSMRFKDIPQYSRAELEGFLQGVLLLEETFGLAPERTGDVVRAIKAGERPKRVAGLSADRKLVEKACEYIVNDPKWGWEDWNNNIMMPLYNASKGEPWGLELAHALSAQSDLYDEATTEERWEQIEKHPADLLGWPRLNWLARQQGMPFLGPLDWDNYRVFMDRKEVLNVTNNQWIISERFNDLFADYKEKKRTVMQTFVKNRPDQVFDTITWDSSLPSGMASKSGRRLWNTWVAPDWWGEPGDITPWLIVMDKIFGNLMHLVIKRMACDVQYPEVRPQWHILVTGENGIGKSTTFYPLMEWAKRFNMHAPITTNMINGPFNAWISRKKIITLNEVVGITSAQFDNLKDMLAGGESEIMVNDKNVKLVPEHLIASFYCSSNHRNALSITKTERRLLVHHSQEPSPEKGSKASKEAYDAFQWVKQNWPRVVHHLKHEVKVSSAFVQVHPGVTAGQREMADMTAPAHERIADNIREIMHNVPVFDMRDVATALAMDESSVDGSMINNGMIRKALSHLGAVRLNNGRSVKIINGHGAEQKRLWSLDRELETAPNEQVRFLYETFRKDEKYS